MADTQPHLYLVDGSSYIFRAYHRLPPLTNRHGSPAARSMAIRRCCGSSPTRLSRPTGRPTWRSSSTPSGTTHRNEMYDQYKAHRPPPPEDLVPQFPLIRTATRAFSIPCIEEAGLEADDIIACYVKAASRQGWKMTIVSSRQGSDAAGRGRAGRHARHDERPPHRPRRCGREVRGAGPRRSATCWR